MLVDDEQSILGQAKILVWCEASYNGYMIRLRGSQRYGSSSGREV